MTAIYRPRQGCIARLTPNAGNRRFVRGGVRMRAVPAEPAPGAEPAPPEDPPETQRAGRYADFGALADDWWGREP